MIYSLVIIFIIISLYFSFLLYSLINRLLKQKELLDNHQKISVVIAIKNEIKNIPGLIKHFSNIDYPQENLEIILVDDNSTDGSFDLMLKLTKEQPLYKVYTVENKKFPGKKGVLAFGIEKSQFNYIMITDADCRPEANWLKIAAGKFAENYDLVFGIAPFITGNSVTNKITCFENLRSSILSIGLTGLNIYFSAAARNFGFRKDSFNKIKGYSNTVETLSGDDDLLIREAVKNNLRIGTMLSEGSRVYSTTKNNLKDYFRQKSRHTKTSFYYLPKIKFVLGLWHLTNIILLSLLPLSLINIYFLIPFLIKIFIDLVITRKYQQRFGYNFKTYEIILLQIIYEIFLIINFFNAAVRKDVW